MVESLMFLVVVVEGRLLELKGDIASIWRDNSTQSAED